jgi:REP element-mobilizing transposase RayT
MAKSKNFCLMDNHVHLIIHPGKDAVDFECIRQTLEYGAQSFWACVGGAIFFPDYRGDTGHGTDVLVSGRESREGWFSGNALGVGIRRALASPA